MDENNKLSGEVIPYQDVLYGEVLPYQAIIYGEVRLPERIDAATYDGPYEYTPSFEMQTAQTAGKYMVHDLTIKSIQTFETSNEYGTTFII